jgi:hypothetical protein
MAHVLPFQRSASVTWPPPVVTSPTAVHRRADSHDTEARLAPSDNDNRRAIAAIKYLES